MVLCLDNDGHSPQSDRLIHFAAEHLQQQGKTVWIAQPEIEGQDYNDVLKQQGPDTVKTELQQAIPYADYRDQKTSGHTLQKTLYQQGQLNRQENPLEKLVKDNELLTQFSNEMNSEFSKNSVTPEKQAIIPQVNIPKPSLKREKEPELEL